MSEPKEYLLAGGVAELERLRVQARVWEPEVEVMLEMIGVAPGWRCIDLGCGAMGILGPLSRRVGPKGEVTGVDMDAKQLAAARAYVAGEDLKNVKVLELDAYNTRLPRESFDLTHVRFVFAPVGRDADLLREMIALTRPGEPSRSKSPTPLPGTRTLHTLRGRSSKRSSLRRSRPAEAISTPARGRLACCDEPA